MMNIFMVIRFNARHGILKYVLLISPYLYRRLSKMKVKIWDWMLFSYLILWKQFLYRLYSVSCEISLIIGYEFHIKNLYLTFHNSNKGHKTSFLFVYITFVCLYFVSFVSLFVTSFYLYHVFILTSVYFYPKCG